MPLGNLKDAFARAQAPPFSVIDPQITDKDIYIHPKNKEDIESVIKGIERANLFGEMGYAGVLMLGPPGTGKTITVQYIGYRTGARFIEAGTLSNPEQVKTLYDYARERTEGEKKKVLIFIDELERVSSRDKIVDPAQAATLNQFLMQLDGTKSNAYIFTFGATNRPDLLDNALRRGKRFGKEIEFWPPDENGRYEILKIHADQKRKKHEFKVEDKDLRELSKVTYGYTGADLSAILTEAFAYANLKDRKDVEFKDLEYALKKIKPAAIRDMPFIEPSLRLEDVAGYDEHKEILRRIVEKSDSSRTLIYGPDGNGKTTMSEALAGSFGYNYIVVPASSPLEGIVGETEKNVERYFDRAKQLSPCVLVFDKVDALVEPREVTSWRASWTGIIESRLARPIEGVHVIGIVTDPTALRETLLQLFDYRIFVDTPTQDDRAKIWEYYLRRAGIDTEKVVPETLAKLRDDLSCVDIRQIVDKIRTFEIEPTSEIMQELVSGEPTENNSDNWGGIVQKTGDCVADYRQVKKFMKEKK